MSRLSHVSRAISAAVVACVAVGVTPASASAINVGGRVKAFYSDLDDDSYGDIDG